MQRRDFLATSMGAILTAGLPEPEPAAWKVYCLGSDYVAARSRGEAQAWYFAFFAQFVPIEAIEEHALERFMGQCFTDPDLPRLKIPIEPWIREQIAAGPQIPCYLFTDGDCC